MLVDDMKKSLHYHKYTFYKMSTVESKKVKKLNKFLFKPFFIYFDCKDFRVSSHIRAHARSRIKDKHTSHRQMHYKTQSRQFLSTLKIFFILFYKVFYSNVRESSML